MHKAVSAFTIQHYILRTPNRKVQCHSCVPCGCADAWKCHRGWRCAPQGQK